MGTAAMKIKERREAINSVLKNKDITFLTKVRVVTAVVFPVVMHGCESWTIKKAECPKNWCFGTVVLEKTLESPLNCTEIQPVHSKGDHSWVFIGKTDAETETPILWPPHAKIWLIGKGPDAQRDWGQDKKGMMEDEMAGCHYWLNDMNLSKLWELAMGWTGKSGVLQFMGLQRVGHDWATELNWMV